LSNYFNSLSGVPFEKKMKATKIISKDDHLMLCIDSSPAVSFSSLWRLLAATKLSLGLCFFG
jgi:hypothetical protein